MSTNGKVKAIIIGPRDHGRRMSLRDFENARGKEGYRYELSRGIITVMQAPKPRHALQMAATRNQFVRFELDNPELIYLISGSLDCKILAWEFESERHPDIAVYLDAPKSLNNWSNWIPGIVVEVVSRSSRNRDYTEKVEEYLAIGVKEYWIVDVEQGKITILQRSRGKWKEKILGRDDIYETKLLPGFQLSCRPIFEAAEKS